MYVCDVCMYVCDVCDVCMYVCDVCDVCDVNIYIYICVCVLEETMPWLREIFFDKEGGKKTCKSPFEQTMGKKSGERQKGRGWGQKE